MRRDDELLRDILDAIEAVGRFTQGRTRDDLDRDELLTAALIQKIILIGEAAASVSERKRQSTTDIPWRQMIGMRKLVVHRYWRVDPAELWRTVQHDLPDLADRLCDAQRDAS